MYKEYYGLSEDPFHISPNPRFLYMSDQHRAAYAHLMYAISESKGFAVITGEAGTGKTTLIQTMLTRVDGHTRTAHLYNPRLSTTDFLKFICEDLGLKTDGRTTKGELLILLHNFLIECYARRERVVLVIDEAQALSHRLLEEVRLLTNLETPKGKLMQVILMGQPELGKVLSEYRFRQLTQRINIRYHIEPLDLDQVRAYIEHRLKVAGYKGESIFTPAAVRMFWKFSKGIPRIINTLCDGAMIIACSREQRIVDEGIARQAIRDMGYLKPKTVSLFRRQALLYAVTGVLLAGVLGIGALAVFKQGAALPPAPVAEKAVAPAPPPIVKKNITLASLARQHYGFANPTILDILLLHNRNITDINRVPADETIEVPPLTDEQFFGTDTDGRPTLYLGTFENEQAIQMLRNHPLLLGETLRTTLREVSSDTHWYSLTAAGFKTKQDAEKVFRSLKEKGALPAFAAQP